MGVEGGHKRIAGGLPADDKLAGGESPGGGKALLGREGQGQVQADGEACLHHNDVLQRAYRRLDEPLAGVGAAG